MSGAKSVVKSVGSWVIGIWRELAKFGIVGLSALVIDIGLCNLLRFAGGQGPMYDRPISSKIVSVAVATTFAYFGNRYWTFRKRGRTNMGREYLMFFGLNAIAMVIAIAMISSIKVSANWPSEMQLRQFRHWVWLFLLRGRTTATAS